MIDDDIIYEDSELPPPPDKDDAEDYTLLAVVLVGVLISLIGIGVFLIYRKRMLKSK